MSDLLYWTVAGVGTLGCVCLFYLNGWDVEETLFGHTSEQEMDTLSGVSNDGENNDRHTSSVDREERQ